MTGIPTLDLFPESLRQKANSQLPNLSGQAWPSIGKFISRMGHSAFIVNLRRRGLKAAFDLYLINSRWRESRFQRGTGSNERRCAKLREESTFEWLWRAISGG